MWGDQFMFLPVQFVSKLLWLQAIPVSGAATAIDFTTSLPAFTTSHQHLFPTKGTSEHLSKEQLYVPHNIMGGSASVLSLAKFT